MSELPELKIIERVYSLPLVSSAVTFGYEKYKKIKGYNQLINQGFTMAESSILFVAHSAKPVVAKFSSSLIDADGLACAALNKVEERVPAIKSSPQELYETSLETISGLKEYGTVKLHDIYKSSRVLSTIDMAVALTGRAIGHIVSNERENAEEKVDEMKNVDKNLINSLKYMPEKMSRRVVSRILNQVDFIRSIYINVLQQYFKLLENKQAGLINRFNKFVEDNPTNPIVVISKRTLMVESYKNIGNIFDSKLFSHASESVHYLAKNVNGFYIELKSSPLNRMPSVITKYIGSSADLIRYWVANNVGLFIPLDWFIFENISTSEQTSVASPEDIHSIVKSTESTESTSKSTEFIESYEEDITISYPVKEETDSKENVD